MTVTTTRSASFLSSIEMREAAACFARWRAPPSRRRRAPPRRLRKPLDLPSTATGSRRARGEERERGHKPSSVSAAGCTPCANSRSSRRVSSSSVSSGRSPPSSGSSVRALREQPRLLEAALRRRAEAPARAAGAARRRPRRCVGATPRARRLVPGLRLQAGVRHREPRRRRHRLEELPVGQERFVVDEHRDLLAAVVDRGDCPARAGRRQVDRPAGVVHEGAGRRQAVADDERRIAECASELARSVALLRAPRSTTRPVTTASAQRPRSRSTQEDDRDESDHDVVRPEDGRSASQPVSRPTAPSASTPANASAAASAGPPALRAGPDVRTNTAQRRERDRGAKRERKDVVPASGSIAPST